MTLNRNELRRQMRARRRKLTPRQRKVAALRIATAADRLHLVRPGRRIAVYLPFGGETDVLPIARRASTRGCEVYVPVVTHRRRFRMHFVPLNRDRALVLNAFGIAEPQHKPSERIASRGLDVVFMPLVAFDARGSRLGSGAGFYDRSLRHLRSHRLWRRPKLIGVAFEHQLTEQLNPNEWDVPMDAVLTETRIHRFKNPASRSSR